MSTKLDKYNTKLAYFKANRDILDTFHAAIFEYKNLPETLDARYIERYLQFTGKVAIIRCTPEMSSSGFPTGSLIACSADLTSDLNPYGEACNVNAISKNGASYTFDRYSENGVVGFNNSLERPVPDINIDALKLAEIDISLDYLIFWTRLCPLLKVADEKQKQIIKEAFAAMTAGEPLIVVGKNLLEDLGVSSKQIEAEALTQPELADKIQYTARLREDLIRWHYTRYGQTIQGDTKMAQQSVDEVNGTISASLIIPLDMLKARQAMVDEINAKFNTNIEVQLSGAWKAEVTKYEAISGEQNIDEEGLSITEGPEEQPEPSTAEEQPDGPEPAPEEPAPIEEAAAEIVEAIAEAIEEEVKDDEEKDSID